MRLLSGALALLPLAARAGALRPATLRIRPGACALLLYAICFSVSYVTVPAGVGALLLFGSVQITMLVVARARGEAWTPARAVASRAPAAASSSSWGSRAPTIP